MLENLNLKQSRLLGYIVFLGTFFMLWRIILFFIPLEYTESGFNVWSFTWGATYQLVALSGAVIGMSVSRLWGGRKSLLGRATIAFSWGLLFQSLGQLISSYYVLQTGDIPYPGLGDIGFFGSIFFYLYGIYLLARIAGVHVGVKNFMHRIQAILIPLIALIGSYAIFLRGYNVTPHEGLKTFLDFGYPLGQALYISIAILVYTLSRNALGGLMRRPLLYFVAALALQYIADFVFLYQASRGLYVAEGVNDLLYLLAYFVMSISLVQLGIVFRKIRNS